MKCFHSPKLSELHQSIFKFMKFYYFSLRFNLNNNKSTTDFILNLALNDLLYCACCLSINTIVYIRRRWDWGQTTCQLYANVVYSNAYSAWMSVALIAASRCLIIANPGRETIFSTRKNRVFAFILIRIISILMLVPDNIPGVSSTYYHIHL